MCPHALHTTDHDTLLSHLREKYGIMGNTTHWMKLYLAGHYLSVDINEPPKKIQLDYGFPQDSTLTPFASTEAGDTELYLT